MNGTVFDEVDLAEPEWTDYDEKACPSMFLRDSTAQTGTDGSSCGCFQFRKCVVKGVKTATVVPIPGL